MAEGAAREGRPRVWGGTRRRDRGPGPRAGTHAERIFTIASRVRRGYTLADWEEELIATVCARDTATFVPATPLQRMLLHAAYDSTLTKSPFYWDRRMGVLRRVRALHAADAEGQVLPADDWAWLEATFKTLHRELRTEVSDVGDLRFWYDVSASQWCTILVTGDPFYDPEVGKVSLMCVARGVLRSIPVRSLAKRLPKGAAA